MGESRIPASTTPSTTPMTIEMTVSSMVTSRPCSTWLEVKYWRTRSHSKRGFVATERPSATARIATIATAIQRPGCRTGTALISSGRPAGASDSLACVVVTRPRRLGRGSVDHGVRDRPGLNSPLLQDRLVLPARDQLLERGLDRLLHAALLRDRDAVRRLAVGLAGDLELAARLLGDVRRHRRVGHAHVGAATRQGEVRAVLVGEDQDAELA